MDAEKLLLKYYSPDTRQGQILLTHSRLVAGKACKIVDAHPELKADRDFVYEAALLHDIGIFRCNAPDIDCKGSYPYICHGYLGADLLREEGFPDHALVAERHTGTGLSASYIKANGLPLPEGRIYEPQTIEQQIICFADKFFSKTRPDTEKSVEKVEASLAKWSDASVEKFKEWRKFFA